MSKPPLALGQQRLCQIVEGPPTGFAAGAFKPRPVVIGAPRADVGALTAGTVGPAIFPLECMDVRLTLFGTEELVDV